MTDQFLSRFEQNLEGTIRPLSLQASVEDKKKNQEVSAGLATAKIW